MPTYQRLHSYLAATNSGQWRFVRRGHRDEAGIARRARVRSGYAVPVDHRNTPNGMLLAPSIAPSLLAVNSAHRSLATTAADSIHYR